MRYNAVMPVKRASSYRLSAVATARIRALAAETGVSQAAVIEVALALLARTYDVSPDVARAMLEEWRERQEGEPS